MCGILAGISPNIVTELQDGLKRLQYRGYDSSGISVISDGVIKSTRAVGKFKELEVKINKEQYQKSTTAMGHVRWATHGSPSIENTHPHKAKQVSIVHNGIIENYLLLKEKLISKGYNFYSETDTEIVAKLVDSKINKTQDLIQAAHDSVDELEGSYAFVLLFEGEDEMLFASRNKTPLILGIPEKDNEQEGIFLASDVIAFPAYIKKVIYLEDGDRIAIRNKDYQIFDSNKKLIERPIVLSTKSEIVTKGKHKHFMKKEILEQPEVVQRIFNDYLGSTRLDELNIDWQNTSRIRIIGCGSAYHAGVIARYWLEELTNIPVDVEIASEYCYRNNANDDKTVTLIISQSGETLDTLEALKKAKKANEKIISIVNSEHSSIARESDYVLPILAGQEIGVASTKAFIAQISVLAALSVHVGTVTKTIGSQKGQSLQDQLISLPEIINKVLETESEIEKIALSLKGYHSALFLGRGNLFPVALEGALKLKELSYIHAEGTPAGELKHGPIALIDENIPIICLVPPQNLNDKMFSNLQEVVARGGKVMSIVSGNVSKEIKELSEWSLSIPSTSDFVAPILFTIPLQILAYHVCIQLNHDADQPRNLAKSVTVE